MVKSIAEKVPSSLMLLSPLPMSLISGTEKVVLSAPIPGALWRTYSRRSSSRFASGRSSTPRITLKMAAFAPMPRARVMATVNHNARARAKERMATFKSRRKDMGDLAG
jgi:hypothetical protein